MVVEVEGRRRKSKSTGSFFPGAKKMYKNAYNSSSSTHLSGGEEEKWEKLLRKQCHYIPNHIHYFTIVHCTRKLQKKVVRK